MAVALKGSVPDGDVPVIVAYLRAAREAGLRPEDASSDLLLLALLLAALDEELGERRAPRQV